MWFHRFSDRLEQEKQAIASLEAAGWVKRVDWHIDENEGTVSADVDFEAGNKLREARLVYPFIYPYAPPQVRPRQAERWSTHQWGTNELCLEIRADNWHTDFNARDMLLSAQKLLDTEATVDDAGVPHRVLADHQFTEGQLLAWRYFRLIISYDLIGEVKRRGVGVHILDLTNIKYDSSSVYTAVAVASSATHDEWGDTGIPPQQRSSAMRIGRIAVLEEGDERHQVLTNTQASSSEIWAQFSSIPFDNLGLVVGILHGRVLAKWLGPDKAFDILEVTMDNQQRTPSRNDNVIGKRVAIVGCGSMGSKVAASLARCGVSNFLLVDGDVLKSGNLVRNDLDWRAVGAHKVDGVKDRILAISPKVKIETWLGRLDGQHSSTYLLDCLKKLSECHLIIETSGSGQGFCMAAAVAGQEKVPMVWGRVFGGGYGGYVVRCRPGIEAPPLNVRHEIYTTMTDPKSYRYTQLTPTPVTRAKFRQRS